MERNEREAHALLCGRDCNANQGRERCETCPDHPFGLWVGLRNALGITLGVGVVGWALWELGGLLVRVVVVGGVT